MLISGQRESRLVFESVSFDQKDGICIQHSLVISRRYKRPMKTSGRSHMLS